MKLSEIQMELKEIKQDNKDLKNTNEALREDVKNFQNKMLAENESLKKKIEELERKVKHLEVNDEKREKYERKNNVIITEKVASTFSKSSEAVKQLIQNVCSGLAREEVNVLSGQFITTNKEGMAVMRGRIETFDMKMKVMKNKRQLINKKERIFINDDLTKQEAEIQKNIRIKAKEESEKGRIVKVGYQKIFIGDKWHRWTEFKNKK